MLFSASHSNATNIKLITRVRPLQQTDHVLPTPYFQVDPPHGTIVLGNSRIFQFENVLPFDYPQHLIFKNHVEPIVNACFEGYNISVIAYGQTGSGKSFTVFGPGLLYTMNESDFGILPRTVRHLFYKAEEFPGRQISIQASYLEIYDEEIHDLLSVEPFHVEITLQEDANTGDVIVSGATKIDCHTIDDVFSCLETGLALRHTGPMFNQLSNKSHGIFTLYMQQRWTQGGCVYDVCSKLHFVDLAGSERLGLNILQDLNEDFQSPTGFQQPFSINPGLLALSNVTSALGDPRRKASHVPYWDSKLTCILKDSLGGNAFTVMIVCLSPSASHLQETLDALKFATRASNISNRPKANVRIIPIADVPGTMAVPQMFLPYGMNNAVNPSHLPQFQFNLYNGVECHTNVPLTTAIEDNHSSLIENEPSDASDEVFKLRFAASQWQLLVANAEILMNELVGNGLLEDEAQNKIQSWLCLKEEYANCIDPDLIAMKPPAQKNPKQPIVNEFINSHNAASIFCTSGDSKTLHVIEEVSEPTPTRELSCELDINPDCISEDSPSDAGSQFTEQLDLLRQQFRETTDRMISNIESVYDTVTFNQKSEISNVNLKADHHLFPISNNFNSFPGIIDQQKRMDSIGDDMNDGISDNSRTYETQNRVSTKMCSTLSLGSQTSPSSPTEQTKNEEQMIGNREQTLRRIPSKDGDTSLSLSKEQKRCQELHDEIKSSKELSCVNAIGSSTPQEFFNDGIRREQLEVDFNFANCVKSTNKSIEKKSCKVNELEDSLSKMKYQQDFLKEQLRQENEEKKGLKQEIDKDHKRIMELERQLKEHKLSSESRFHEFCVEKEDSPRDSELEHKWRWLVAEEERLVELRTEITWRSEELEERENNLEKREIALVRSVNRSESDKQAISTNVDLVESLKRQVDSNDVVGASQMLQMSPDQPSVVNSNSSRAPSHDPLSDKEAIRKEIRKMRHTRDSLVQQRQEIDERQHRGLELDAVEERRMIELDEAIEAVDAAIEYKNELICSRHYELNTQTEDGLLTRLMSLSHAETRSLLCKYFQKVIDLREGSKKMEVQFAELEAQFEDQTRYVRKLSAALKHTQLEIERRSTSHRRNYDLKSSAMQGQLDHVGRTESYASSALHADRKPNPADEDADQQHSRELRRQLRDLLSVTPKNRAEGGHHPHHGLPTSAEQAPSAYGSRTPSLLGLQAVQALHKKITGLQRSRGRNAGPETTTTVTREKNKLIIKQQTVPSETRDTKRRHH